MHNNRLQSALTLLSQKKHEKVHAQAIEMIKLNTKDALPYCLLGMIANDYGNHFKAIELFSSAVNLEPDNAFYQAYLGQALTTVGEQQKAKACADRAAKLPVDDAYLADTIGVIYTRTGFHEDAIPFFHKAVELNNKPANFHYNLAASQQFIGDFKRAEQSYFLTLERDPKAYRAWSSLVALNKQSLDSNYIDEMVRLFEELQVDEDACLHLGHAIAKTFEDMGQYRESLEWLHKAKALKLKNTSVDKFSYDSLFEAAKSTVNFNVKANENSSEYNQESPIFIVGLPRTGTTLLDRIISSHRDVISAGELNVFPGLLKKATNTSSNLVMDADTFLKANLVNFKKLGEDYLNATLDLSRGSLRFTDKMPLNFFYVALIHKALPNARIIVLRRGAMDSCLSNYRQLLTVQHSYYHYTYDLKQTADFYRQFDDLMAHWRTHLPADRFTEINYEDIVHDQENQTRRILNFCDLDWQDQCLDFHQNQAPVSTASSVQVRQPLYSGSIGRWQRYGNDLDVLKDALGDLGEPS